MIFKRILNLTESLALLAAACTFGCSSSNNGTDMAGGGSGGSGGGSDMAAAPMTAYKYAGAGTDWTWNLNADGTFDSDEVSTSVTVHGSYSRLTSGFDKLTVISSTGTGAPAAGTDLVAVEVPGVAFMVKPVLGTETQVITAIAAGGCPTADFSTNWLKTQFPVGADLSLTTASAFGTFSWTNATSTGTVGTSYATAGYMLNAGSPIALTGTCSGGSLSFTAGSTTGKLYLASNGSAFIKASTGDGYLALPGGTIGASTTLAGNYAGLMFDDHATIKVSPVQGVVNAGGTSVTINGLTDIVAGTQDPAITGSISLDATNMPIAGFIEATATTAGGTGKLSCMAQTNLLSSGKSVIMCVGQSPNAPTAAFNVLLVSH